MSAAAERLKQFTARINRLMDERDALTSDIRDVFTEVKSAGFSPPALRKVIAAMRMDPAKRDEIEAMVEMYRDAVGLAKPEAIEMLASGKTIRETNRVTGVALGTLHRRSKTAAKAKTEHHDPETDEITKTDRVATSGAPERPAAQGGESLPPRRDPIPESPAGAAPSEPATDRAQVAALTPPSAVPAGEPDPDGHWERRDGEGNYILPLQVANGKVPHPADVSHVVPVRPDTTAIDDGMTIPAHLRVGTEANRIARGGR